MTERTIRALSSAEVETLVGWAAAEGWNPGLVDAPAFHATDPDGFIGAFVGGEMVAAISAVAYGKSYGFIGLYICRPGMRGRGHGKAVWSAAMARLAGRTIGLDGVDQQLDNYRAKGFAPAYRTIRFGGKPLPRDAREAGIGASTAATMAGFAAFDRTAFPEPRPAFLERWLAPPHLVRVATGPRGLTGYGVMRPCRDGWKIGGLAADDDATAWALFSMLADLANGDVYIDVPAPRRPFIDRLLAAGLRPVFETTRMYLGSPIPLADRLFAVTSLELG